MTIKFCLTSLILMLLGMPSMSQKAALDSLLRDSIMINGAVSFTVRDADKGVILFDYNGEKSLSQASVMKLVTTAAAIEILGPGHRFTTTVGYSGHITPKGKLIGDIVIRGGGDPALGSERFPEYYTNFLEKWADEINNLGIRKVKGRVICDDSYFDYYPVPPKWMWEDIGNYYGAGVYGLSIYENTIKRHYLTGKEGSRPHLTYSEPSLRIISFADSLLASGSTDEGYAWSAPYSGNGWITGTIPANMNDFILKVSIPDPPLAAAQIFDKVLKARNISTGSKPSTTRLKGSPEGTGFAEIARTPSPPLSEILVPLNHESINLYAEDLLKELGKTAGGGGSTLEGIKVVRHFLDSLGVNIKGLFIEDGCGLSPQDAINSSALSDLLSKMKRNGRYFNIFYNSLPGAGKDGTLKNVFKDPVFESSLRAKSGSIERVRSYAGYLTAKSGKALTFSIITNNFRGSSRAVVPFIEQIIKETYLNY
ncbi:MAG TPA: D-alanyl-D-alanine carboxypeptidase/D-alanyl-D-alanine-endopeptidase [Bacteroidales bacterium]|nr:D-alanyl-D-alanine carboxypeptidase/D-alanyl-D-alanine-endopeptidase [Bacteroidales bacterium]